MSTAKFNQWPNSDGTENYKCRAWVNFNGTGTVAIRASGNVSSITDNGAGDYTVNFTTAMPDANYSIGYMTDEAAGGVPVTYLNGGVARTASSFRMYVYSLGSAAFRDPTTVVINVFR